MATTLKDIAERAQVSVATVSMAMGSPGRIAEATRRRVLQIADEMGYRPNMLVRGIQKGRTMSVGVLMGFAGDLYEARIFQGMHHTLVKAGYVPIALMPSEDIPILDQIHALLDRRVDGILLRPTGMAMWEKHLHEALDRKIPVVSVDTETQAETHHVDFVGTHDVKGGRLAARALLEAGHRRLAVLTTGDFAQPMYFRREGFEAEVSQAAGANCVSMIQPWAEVLDDDSVARQLLSLSPRPTGVFVTIGRLAECVYRAAAEMGLRVPEDLSVVGFGDERIASRLTPGLTTLRQQPRQIGQLGAQLLLDRIRRGEPRGERQRILIEPEWIARESVSSPPPNPSRPAPEN